MAKRPRGSEEQCSARKIGVFCCVHTGSVAVIIYSGRRDRASGLPDSDPDRCFTTKWNPESNIAQRACRRFKILDLEKYTRFCDGR